MGRLLPVLWLLATLGCATALAQPAIELTDRMAGVNIGPRVDILEDPTKALTLGEVRRAAAAGRFMPAPARGVNLGFRHFAFQNQAEPMFHINGPVAELKLAF